MKPSDILKEKLGDVNQDHSGREQLDIPKKLVSPLQQLLMEVSIEGLMAFLHKSHIRWSASRGAKGYYVVTIFKEGMLTYIGTSGASPRAAFADALAKFLVKEKEDFHDYGWDQKPKKQEEPEL